MSDLYVHEIRIIGIDRSFYPLHGKVDLPRDLSYISFQRDSKLHAFIPMNSVAFIGSNKPLI